MNPKTGGTVVPVLCTRPRLEQPELAELKHAMGKNDDEDIGREHDDDGCS